MSLLINNITVFYLIENINCGNNKNRGEKMIYVVIFELGVFIGIGLMCLFQINKK